MAQAINVPGVGTVNFPDGMSQADMIAAIQKNFPQIHGQVQQQAPAPQQAPQPQQQPPVDFGGAGPLSPPTQPMTDLPAATGQGALAVGKGLARGALNTMAEMTGDSPQQAAARDQYLGLGTPTGGAAEFVGGLAAPTPGKVAAFESKVAGVADMARAQAVKILQDAGIPLDKAQETGSKLWQTVRNIVADNPLVGGGSFDAGQKAAFTRATLKMIGEDSDRATPTVMERAQGTIGNMFQDVFSRNRIAMDGAGPTLLNDLAGIEDDASTELKGDQLGVIKSQITNLINQAAKGDGYIDGLAAQNAKKILDRLSMGADTSVGFYARQIRESLLDAMQRSVSPQDMQKFTQARTMWRRMEQIAPSIGNDDRITPSALYRTIDTLRNQQQVVYGKGDQALPQLAQAGAQVMQDSANSGTVRRAAGLATVGAVGAALEDARRGDYSTATKFGLLAFLGPVGLRYVLQHPEMGDKVASMAASNLQKTAPRLAAGYNAYRVQQTTAGASAIPTQAAPNTQSLPTQ